MNLKKLKLLGTLIAFFIAFPLHFLYDLFPNFIMSIFSPVNESIWEHMKILFGSIILSGVIQKIIVKTKKLKYNNICFSNFISAVSSIFIFLTLYLPIYYLAGENLFLTLLIMFTVIMLSEIIGIFIIKKKDLRLENKTIILVMIIYFIFTFLTYYPPKTNLFLDPSKLIYGIKNS